MRRVICVLILAALVGSAYAELQNVEVGGEIRIRGRWWRNAFAGNWYQAGGGITRINNAAVARRPIGPFGLTSAYDWDDRGHDLKFIEQRTVVNVKADFTDQVSAFIELENYDRWGQDFRSNYLTGVDGRANTADDVEVFQAYIQADEMFGQPLSLRIGRQELTMGDGWLAGSRISPTLGISYDAVRVTYTPGDFTIDAWLSKLAENSPLEEDGDVDYYGLWATYAGIENLNLSAYWLYVRDAREAAYTNLPWYLEWGEDVLDLDQYDVTNLHTVGIRAWGKLNALDYNLNLAYQFGDAEHHGFLFPQASLFGVYGDDNADYDSWAGDIELGYTFDVNWQPRVYIGGAYFDGEDNRDLSFCEWLNPFDRPDASVSFNRMFSQWWYSATLDIIGGASAMTNFHQIRAGVSAKPTECISTGLSVAYFGVNEPFDWPRYWTLPNLFGRVPIRYPIAPVFGFWTEEADDDIGYVTHVWLKYNITEDLWVKFGWEHLFTGDALADGNFINKNGLEMSGGTDDDDADYIYFDMQLKF